MKAASPGLKTSSKDVVRGCQARFAPQDEAMAVGGREAPSCSMAQGLKTFESEVRSGAGVLDFEAALVGGTVHLQSIAVRPSFRGKGLGSAILIGLTSWADRHQVWITLDAASSRLVRFYRRFGFERQTYGLRMERPPKR